ncbi:MAG: acetate--CoA ligase [Pseudomonadota bacterium]
MKAITVRKKLSQDTSLYYTPKESHASLSKEEFQKLQKQAQENLSDYWATIAREKISWDKDFSIVENCSFAPDAVSIKWFEDGMLNACYNTVDRHLEHRGDKVALIWESDCGEKTEQFTYRALHDEVVKCAAILQKMGVKKGDRVVIYMPMIPKAVFAMLACARIGAVHCVVFGGFSAKALKDRIETAEAKWVITADEGKRGGKIVSLKVNVDMAINDSTHVQNVLVIQHSYNDNISYQPGRDIKYDDLTATLSGKEQVPCVSVNAEHPFFILHTSGSTGKPKGLLHTTGGYMVNVAHTHALAFDLREDDVYFCTADIGWITGHSYMVYGPLANGATMLMFEGVPTYPDAGRLWNICQKHKVSILYTAPTALRTLMGAGDDYVKKYDLSALRVLGTVGEPINPEVWQWYYDVVGRKNCPIIDTWWQTETGAFMISPIANISSMRPGYAGEPLPSIAAKIVDTQSQPVEAPNEAGHLVFAKSWPSQARTIWGDHKRFEETYFSTHPHHYFCGDGARRDANGFIQITGRVDDVLNVSGHRLGTAEIESALVKHPDISEAAIVGYPHDIKGEGIYAYVTLMEHAEHAEHAGHPAKSQNLLSELKAIVREEIGPIAMIDIFHITSDMPKTRSGKIMRRILRKIASGDYDQLGDISTLANSESVETIIQYHKNIKKAG